jgi:hypothetical protein
LALANAWSESDLPPEERDRLAVLEGFDDTDILDVIAGPPARVAGLRVTVVVFYGAGVGIEWHRSDGPVEVPEDWEPDELDAEKATELHEMFSGLFSLTDDVGTTYVGARGTSGGGGPGVMFGGYHFAPAVPESATRLELEVAGETLAVPLPR